VGQAFQAAHSEYLSPFSMAASATMSRSSNRRRGVTVTLGKTEVTKLGVAPFNWHDAYHLIMSLTWPQFFAGAVFVYLVVNLGFATAYFLGDHAINNAAAFIDCFFFSVETLATVGYGSMSPATLYGHCIATAEIITGMLSMAVITSLVFARFSKPTARILFSRVAVIARFDGVPTLMLRVANQRRSYILEAMASLVLIRDEHSVDGHKLRRFHDLKLERARSPLFALSWLIMHRIDESSPLHGVTAAAIEDGDMRLAVTLSGVDETFAAGINARYNYSHEDILFERKFVDIFTEGEHPRHLYIDLERFHEHEATDGS
jgi:inward rectifier potassium channel